RGGLQVRVLHLPGLPEKGDVSDWLAAGGTRDRLLALIDQPVEVDNGPRLLTMAELLTEPTQSTEWLVEGLLPQSGFSIVSAKPKVGKSCFARQLALSVSRGDPFLNLPTQQGVVVYLALEERRDGFRQHF